MLVENGLCGNLMDLRKSFLCIIIACLSWQCMSSPCLAQDFSPLFWGYTLEGLPTAAEIIEVNGEAMVQADIINFFLQWPKEGNEGIFPLDSLQAIWNAGALPCLTWEPMYYEGKERTTIAAEQLLEKRFDVYLKSFVKAIKSWNKPLIIRFAHEMNLQEYHWGSNKAEEYSALSPKKYVEMFRYVVDFFRKEGAENVLFVFCPNADSVPSHPWNIVSAYYPGDSYVDIFGMDGYNWQDASSQNGRSFEEIFRALYGQLNALSTKKPIIVFETAMAVSGKERQQWLSDAMEKAKEWNLRGVLWFQVNKERDWRLGRVFGDDLSAVLKARSFSQRWGNVLIREKR